eukprot:12827491-Prorocentrum_lima.AAC.1
MASQRRRLVKILNELTVRWATNRLPPACGWLLDTQVIFLRKDRNEAKQFDDEVWLEFAKQTCGHIGASPD